MWQWQLADGPLAFPTEDETPGQRVRHLGGDLVAQATQHTPSAGSFFFFMLSLLLLLLL